MKICVFTVNEFMNHKIKILARCFSIGITWINTDIVSIGDINDFEIFLEI
jgi:hypothetical protein